MFVNAITPNVQSRCLPVIPMPSALGSPFVHGANKCTLNPSQAPKESEWVSEGERKREIDRDCDSLSEKFIAFATCNLITSSRAFISCNVKCFAQLIIPKIVDILIKKKEKSSTLISNPFNLFYFENSLYTVWNCFKGWCTGLQIFIEL